jgi:prevent-host-death family protein
MERAVTAADANRKFSSILRTVCKGKSYVVTVHGKPVAKILPVSEGEQKRTAAHAALFARLESQPAINIGRWTRDELHDE